jgi:FkbM family methyltransferase
MKNIEIPSLGLKPIIDNSPITIVDIGAAGGVQPVWRQRGFERFCSYYGFEANPDNYNKLPIEKSTKYFQIAISDRSGVFPFNVHSTVSSLVDRKDRKASFDEEFSVIDVRTETLDNLRSANELPSLDVVKTDIERHDYFALKGAGEYLKNETLCVVSEFEYYGGEEGSRFRDIDQLLCDSGMMLFGLQHKTGALGELSGGDLLYLKDIGWVINSNTELANKIEQLLKLYLICMLLSKYQYAYAIAKAGEEHGLWSLQDAKELCDQVLNNVFLPFAVPLRTAGLKIAHGFSLLAQIFSGAKWAGKAAPRVSCLYPLQQMTVSPVYIPTSWSLRYKKYLDGMYDRYKKLSGNFIFYR